jgi:hypothetical protein
VAHGLSAVGAAPTTNVSSEISQPHTDLLPSLRFGFDEHAVAWCAAPGGAQFMGSQSQPFRAGLKFGAGPPGLEWGHHFPVFVPSWSKQASGSTN